MESSVPPSLKGMAIMADWLGTGPTRPSYPCLVTQAREQC